MVHIDKEKIKRLAYRLGSYAKEGFGPEGFIITTSPDGAGVKYDAVDIGNSILTIILKDT